jgi:hypothetical protein
MLVVDIRRSQQAILACLNVRTGLPLEGVRYDNDYCLEGGKIKEIREYCDSMLTEKALGKFPHGAGS